MVRDFKAALFHPATLVQWAVLSVLLTVSGPFATYIAPLADRLVFWSSLTAAGLCLGIAARLAIRRRFPDFTYWQRAGLSSAVVAGLLALPAQRVTALMAGRASMDDAASGLAEAGAAVFLCAMGLHALRYALIPREPASDTPRPALLARLPEVSRGHVIRLSSRDHYVRVVTDAGHAEILMRFADAIAELEGIDGLQVHRSHWVAADAVTGHRHADGRLFLVLRDGTEVPVSRRYRPDVEARVLAPDA
ncbi:transcriptional regulator, LytTR family [Rhodovulum sp. ES.010]|nr:transcriptional regulator, LytTR family [Rhodovulum sp. ES.010]